MSFRSDITHHTICRAKMTYHEVANNGAILNLPFQSGGFEGKSHMKAKVKVAQALKNAGYVVEYERQFLCPGRGYHGEDITHFTDIHLPQFGIVVEIDGKTHWSKRAKSKDYWKDENLESIGKRVIRMTIEEALDYPEQIIPRLPKPDSVDIRPDVEMIKEEVIAWPGPFVE